MILEYGSDAYAELAIVLCISVEYRIFYSILLIISRSSSISSLLNFSSLTINDSSEAGEPLK